MRAAPLYLVASNQFWAQAAQRFMGLVKAIDAELLNGRDFSSIRVLVPTFAHSQLFLHSLHEFIGRSFVPPRIHTLFAWIESQVPDPAAVHPVTEGERLMDLYGELRQHAWLKKLFTVSRNTDLLPLAQTLLSLSDELTRHFLPQVQNGTAQLDRRWEEVLSQLPLPAQKMLSEEAQLVWSIWKGQLEGRDAGIVRYKKIMSIADQARENLIWISPTAPDAIEDAFLARYALTQDVFSILLDWKAPAITNPLAQAWSEMLNPAERAKDASTAVSESAVPASLHLLPAYSLEDEAQKGAQTIIAWLLEGKQNLAVIAQDRAIARRIRALLERAEVYVADETGWKLSTTRAAAALTAWFDVVVTRADTMALLDLLKSPFLVSPKMEGDEVDKADRIMHIEFALRRANVLGGWDAIAFALAAAPSEARWIAALHNLANNYSSRKKISDWASQTLQTLKDLDMFGSLQVDVAGQQILQVMQTINAEWRNSETIFSFAEWRAFINLQLESAPFVVANTDRRVVMLPLNGARLRHFDAVLLVGADAAHLPSPPQETLFFSNSIKRELGLQTREERHRQQLRDFAELVLSNPLVVCSWQSVRDGEHNPISPWIAQLQLALARGEHAPLPELLTALPQQTLSTIPALPPQPSAEQLLPVTLSASGMNSLLACPYQFFAGRMMRLNAIDELADMPEKRDYGDWLHAILKTFHDALLAQPDADKELLLREISQRAFDTILQHNPAALGYSVRWQKVQPAYVAWVNQREAEGWQFAIGEVALERHLQWQGGEVQLRGRLDRIDHHPQQGSAILDYKTTTLSVLKKRVSGTEDCQLPFYALMAEDMPSEASYVALEMQAGKLGVAVATDIAERANVLQQAIGRTMQAIQGGAALPANGAESVCQYCDMRGLCRKGAW